ncbi:hypothetical protein CMK12_02965 [Candidatus Poribacteria bacterium]|nr:hypothetical protein [Candidatus Poribacteria bacterium]
MTRREVSTLPNNQKVPRALSLVCSDLWWVRKLTPYPELHVHPSTAEEQDIKGSNKVAIKTPKGSVQHMIKLTEDIHREVVIRVYG